MDQSICCGDVPVMGISSAEPRYFFFKQHESVLNILEEAITQAVEHKFIYCCVSKRLTYEQKIFKHLLRIALDT
jgi:hypothetical protein